MNRYISSIVTMSSVSSVSRFEHVVAGVAILGAVTLLHRAALLWRWAPSGMGANRRAICGFARA
jgi:hypothetical protein